MANKTVLLKDENSNILYPITEYNAVKDENGNSLPSDFSNISQAISKNNISNINILSNGNFEFNSSAVDTYGDATDTTTASPSVIETATGWFFERDYNGTFTISTKTLEVGSAGSFARLYGNTNLQANQYENKKFTLTVNVSGNSSAFYYGIGYGDSSVNNSYTSIVENSNSGSGEFSVSGTIPTSLANANIIKLRLYKNVGSIVINWVKLEIGEDSTIYLPREETKEKISVIYDMRSTDPNINRTWTDGATYGKMIRTDFTAYTAIRVFASINGCEVQKVIKVAGRKKSDFSVNAINSTFDQISFLRFTFSINGSAFQVGQYCKYTWDFDYNTFSAVKGSSNVDFYMYRLEGIY